MIIEGYKVGRVIHKGLTAPRFRYRFYRLKLPGKGKKFDQRCFWHTNNCHLFKWPSTRKEFRKAKILLNKKRDQENLKQYFDVGWKTLVIWKCALK
jgi:DNA mismatch endonuclease (patch repair protein)